MLVLYLHHQPANGCAFRNATRSEDGKIRNAPGLIGRINEQIGGTITEDRDEQVTNVWIEIPLLTPGATGNRRDNFIKARAATGSILASAWGGPTEDPWWPVVPPPP